MANTQVQDHYSRFSEFRQEMSPENRSLGLKSKGKGGENVKSRVNYLKNRQNLDDFTSK